MASIDQKLANLEEKVALLEQALNAVGLPTSKAVSIPDAAKLMQITAYTIRREIKQAESMRLRDLPYDLKYGAHYFKEGKEYRVFPQKMRKVLMVPPDERMPFIEESDVA